MVVVVVVVLKVVVVARRWWWWWRVADRSGLPRSRKGMKRSRECTRRVSALSTAIGRGVDPDVPLDVESLFGQRLARLVNVTGDREK